MNKGRQLADYFRSKAEEITELKKSTLQSYTAKAVGSKSSLDFMRGVKMAQGSGGEEELRTKSNKRSEGIHRAIKKIAEGKVPDDHGRYIADADKRTLGKLADLMQKQRPKKKPETPDEIKQSVKEEQINEVSDELATKVGMARTANVNKAGAEYRHTSIMGSESQRKTAHEKLKAAEAKRDKGTKVQVARRDRQTKSFMKHHAEKMAARSPEQVKKDNEAENAERHKNYKERGWTLD